MTQPSRTTESMHRDHAAIRDVMQQARNLTVPDRATLAVGLVGNLATLMNRSQMSKLLDELREEAERVQDVPPSRQREIPSDSTEAAGEAHPAGEPERGERGADNAAVHRQVGQAGRGEFRADELL